MTRAVAPLAAALLLAGCPLPQPLPDYPPGTVTPPRILAATTTRPAESIITVPAGCTGAPPAYGLGARIFYPSNVTVEARWFVDYRKDLTQRTLIVNSTNTEVPADPDPTVLERVVPPLVFEPYDFQPPAELGLSPDPAQPGVVHVVELVVSNGFDPDPNAPEPNRTPGFTDGGARFEIQAFRWVFVNVTPQPGCTPGDPGCCP